MASGKSEVLFEWIAANQRLGSVGGSCKKGKEYVMTIEVPNFQVHGLLHKTPVVGEFHIHPGTDLQSFEFHVTQKPSGDILFSCNVSGLPGKFSELQHKLKEDFIMITIVKQVKETWEGKCQFKIVKRKPEDPPTQ